MRITALILGILGGVVGLLATAVMLVVAIAAKNDGLIGWGLLGMTCCSAGLVGAGATLEKPRLAAVLLLPAGVMLLLGNGGFALVSAPLLITAGILAACAIGPRPVGPAVITPAGPDAGLALSTAPPRLSWLERDRQRAERAELAENRSWLERQATEAVEDAR